VAAEITNTLGEAISVHWHGLIVPGDVDGGPHQPVAAGGTWAPVLPLDQMPATLWYHSHIHGKTAPQVYRGLAGVIHLTDGEDDARALPARYGIDDLTLVIQDRRFDPRGRMIYNPVMHDLMMGFEGNVMMVNGQVAPFARVPKGVVRLRLLNASNARVLHGHDGRGHDGRGPGMMRRRRGAPFSINGQPFSMKRLNFTAPQGALERWVIRGEMMMHPFHVHGCAFQVLSENGRPPAPQNRGWNEKRQTSAPGRR